MKQTTPPSDSTAGTSASPRSNPLDILLIHNRWANEQVLGACEGLTREQFHQKFEMGLGSLHDTIVHVLGAMRGWTDMLRGDMQPGKTPRPRLESEGEKTAGKLLALHCVVADELDDVVRTGSLDDLMSGERGGRTYAFTRGGIATHVTTHGMHHRAQCLNMMRVLGAEPLPPTAVVEWMVMVDMA
jgi:uncharacterized damage-inducible protein DinB